MRYEWERPKEEEYIPFQDGLECTGSVEQAWGWFEINSDRFGDAKQKELHCKRDKPNGGMHIPKKAILKRLRRHRIDGRKVPEGQEPTEIY